MRNQTATPALKKQYIPTAADIDACVNLKLDGHKKGDDAGELWELLVEGKKLTNPKAFIKSKHDKDLYRCGMTETTYRGKGFEERKKYERVEKADERRTGRFVAYLIKSKSKHKVQYQPKPKFVRMNAGVLSMDSSVGDDDAELTMHEFIEAKELEELSVAARNARTQTLGDDDEFICDVLREFGYEGISAVSQITGHSHALTSRAGEMIIDTLIAKITSHGYDEFGVPVDLFGRESDSGLVLDAEMKAKIEALLDRKMVPVQRVKLDFSAVVSLIVNDMIGITETAAMAICEVGEFSVAQKRILLNRINQKMAAGSGGDGVGQEQEMAVA